ncbi:MAG: hypothetical protein ABSA50_13015 [Candidatus Bathyarchaeia archaeon]
MPSLQIRVRGSDCVSTGYQNSAQDRQCRVELRIRFSAYSLSTGWDLVGFKPQPLVTDETVWVYLSSIAGHYPMNSVWVYNNESADWIRIDSSDVLRPGQAIWILVTAPAKLKP